MTVENNLKNIYYQNTIISYNLGGFITVWKMMRY